VKAGTEEEAIRYLTAMIEPTRAEEGNIFYQPHRSASEPNRFFIYEQYEDVAAIDFHRQTPHFQEYIANGLFNIMESRSPEMYEPVG
jgi:quinol monooxygenase YgiN